MLHSSIKETNSYNITCLPRVHTNSILGQVLHRFQIELTCINFRFMSITQRIQYVTRFFFVFLCDNRILKKRKEKGRQMLPNDENKNPY